MIKFENTEYLFLIFLIIPSYFFYFSKLRKIKKIYKYTNASKKIFKKLFLRSLFFSFAWISLIIALACPLYGSKTFFVQRKGLSIIFVMDISKSMTINDVSADRLTAGKYFADLLIKRYEQSSFGLVIAKGEGILALPLSFEQRTVSNTIMNLSCLSMSSSGTNLEAGVTKAFNSFNPESGNFKIIILITDGEETKGNLKKAAALINKSDVIFIIAGVGSKNGKKLTFFDESGEELERVSYLNEKFLNEISTIAGENSFYVNIFSPSGFNLSGEKIFHFLDEKYKGLEKVVFIREPVKRNFEFSLLAFIFFCIGVMCYYEKQKI